MKNFDSYYDQPDDDPCCESGCGDTLIRDVYTYEWVCANKFCPTKFDGIEKEMAEALVEALEEIRTLKAVSQKIKSELGEYKNKFGSLMSLRRLY